MNDDCASQRIFLCRQKKIEIIEWKEEKKCSTTTDDVTILILKSQRAANAKQIKKYISKKKYNVCAENERLFCVQIKIDRSIDVAHSLESLMLPRVSLKDAFLQLLTLTAQHTYALKVCLRICVWIGIFVLKQQTSNPEMKNFSIHSA